MEIVPSLKSFRFQVLGDEFKGGTEIHCEGPFGVWCGDEHHCTAGGVNTFEKDGFYAALLLVTLEKGTEVVVSDLADEGCIHSKDGGAAFI